MSKNTENWSEKINSLRQRAYNYFNNKNRKETVVRTILFAVIFLTVLLGVMNLPSIIGLPMIPISTEDVPATEISIVAVASASPSAIATNAPTATAVATNVPTATAVATIAPTATADGTMILSGTYDLSIPYYQVVDETTFVESVVPAEDIDPRIAFLTNSAVEEIFYTNNAPVRVINDTEYMAVYRRSYLLEKDLDHKRNNSAIMYVEKSNIKASLQASTPAEMFLRNRILDGNSSFSVKQMKSEKDVYRVDLAYYVIGRIRTVDICENGGEYGVVDILVYVPGKGLQKHGLAVVFFNKKGQLDPFENLYRYNENIQDTGAEARIATTMFSFTNHTDFTQSFNYSDWFNNITKMNDGDSSWNHAEGKTAYRHAPCFANEYEKFLETKGEEYTIFLMSEQISTSGFADGTVDDRNPITPEEFKAIFNFVGYNPLIGLGEE